MAEPNPHDVSEQQGKPTGDEAAKSGGRGAVVKLVVLIAVIAGLFVAFRFLPVNEYLTAFLEYVRALGAWGPVLLIVVYIIATVFMVPGSILSLGAGFVFGVVKGTIIISIASTLGAIAAFIAGRTLARGFVEQKAKENPSFGAIDRAVERSGFKIVLLTRLSPVFPFNLLNYLFSITNVRLRDYAIASWIGMLPGTVMYVYLGFAAKDLAQIASGNIEGGIGQKVLLGVGLVATIAVTIVITRIARNALKDKVPEAVDKAEAA